MEFSVFLITLAFYTICIQLKYLIINQHFKTLRCVVLFYYTNCKSSAVAEMAAQCCTTRMQYLSFDALYRSMLEKVNKLLSGSHEGLWESGGRQRAPVSNKSSYLRAVYKQVAVRRRPTLRVGLVVLMLKVHWMAAVLYT